MNVAFLIFLSTSFALSLIALGSMSADGPLLHRILLGLAFLSSYAGFVLLFRRTARRNQSGNECKGHDFSKIRTIFLFIPVVMPLILIPAGYFFSDDAIRHIFDGYYLKHGADIYLNAPRTLGAALGLMPNHPGIPTIYLPTTQLQTYAGAYLDERWGFLVIYHLSTAILLFTILFMSHGLERTYIYYISLSPAFLFALSSRHADLFGMLVLLASIMLLGRHRRVSLHRFVSGMLAGILPGLKPEGALLCIFLVIFIYSNQRGNHRRFWFYGLFSSLFILFAFAAVVLFPNWASLLSYSKTLKLFALSFVAYNPFISFFAWYGGYENHQILEAYQVVVILIVTAVSLTAFFLYRQRIKQMWRYAPILSLGAYMMLKGAWHPWYFFWMLPALYFAGMKRSLLLLVAILPLFYVPVIDLRFSGVWEFGAFYILAALAIVVWIWLTGNRGGIRL